MLFQEQIWKLGSSSNSVLGSTSNLGVVDIKGVETSSFKGVDAYEDEAASELRCRSANS